MTAQIHNQDCVMGMANELAPESAYVKPEPAAQAPSPSRDGIRPSLEKVLRAVREEHGDVFQLCPRCRCCELTVDFNWFREREKFCSGRCDERGFHIERPERVALLYERG